ncbi:MAG: hypothetical protein ACI4RI_01000 [Ruminococcus sp.]
MSSFKDVINADIKSVFINENEFSDKHMINNKEMIVQIDDNEAIERQLKINPNTGIFTRQLIIYVSTEDFGKMPYIGQVINLDGLIYRVVNVSSETGIYAITIERSKT